MGLPLRLLNAPSANTTELDTLESRTSTTASHTSATESRSDVPESRSLDALSDSVRRIEGVWADDLQMGDRLVVQTQNSVYTLTALGDGRFQVAGGWFAAHDVESTPVRVIGCTWGGHAIMTRLVAAPGMCIEFDNTVQTTFVRHLHVICCAETDVRH